MGQASAARATVAVPVTPREAIFEIERVADDVATVVAATDLEAVGQFYQDFQPVSNEVVRLALHKSQST